MTIAIPGYNDLFHKPDLLLIKVKKIKFADHKHFAIFRRQDSNAEGK